ncbi:MAG: SDR family oxidoreductase [archaeon]
MVELKGKVMIVTGASRGLGKALAKEAGARGARVVLAGRSEQLLKAVEGELASSFAVKCDVTDGHEIGTLVKKVVEKFGRIDILVNNAGIWIPQDLEELDLARVREMFEVNVFGLMAVSKAVFLQMKKQGGGMIVNVISTAGLEAKSKRSPAYTASKFAATGFAQSLRHCGAEEGIKVINIYPGGMRTDFHNERKPADWENFMDPSFVAGKIVENLEKDAPEEELVLKRPGK